MPVATGADADRLIDAARRRTTSRRELSGVPAYARISPEVGVFDENAMRAELEGDPDGALALLADMTGATDARVAELARQFAARLMVDLGRHREQRRGMGRIVSQPMRDDLGDLDLDRSLEGVLASRAGAVDKELDGGLWVRDWQRPELSLCLLVDRSGSMLGRSLATAALAASAVAHRVRNHRYAVLCFSRDVVAAKAMWEERPVEDVAERVLALRGHGTTDVAAALRAAADQMWLAPPGRRVTVVLSDCRATEHGDVEAACAPLDELAIVAPERDSAEARRLADAVGARFAVVGGPSSVVAAISSVLSD